MESLTPEDIARIFGVHWNRQAEEAEEGQEAEAQEILDSDQEDTQETQQADAGRLAGLSTADIC